MGGRCYLNPVHVSDLTGTEIDIHQVWHVTPNQVGLESLPVQPSDFLKGRRLLRSEVSRNHYHLKLAAKLQLLVHTQRTHCEISDHQLILVHIPIKYFSDVPAWICQQLPVLISPRQCTSQDPAAPIVAVNIYLCEQKIEQKGSRKAYHARRLKEFLGPDAVSLVLLLVDSLSAQVAKDIVDHHRPLDHREQPSTDKLVEMELSSSIDTLPGYYQILHRLVCTDSGDVQKYFLGDLIQLLERQIQDRGHYIASS